MSDPPRLDDLIQGCLNGTLDAAAEQELARLLERAAEARQALRAHLRVEAGLLSLGKAGELAGVAAPRPAARRFRGALAAAAVLLALASVMALRSPPPGPAGGGTVHVVALEGTVDVVAPGGLAHPAGPREALRPGDSLRTGGGASVAVVEFGNAARLELSPETVIRVPNAGPLEVELVQGVVRGLDAADPPLTVTTPAARVRVEGERFVVSSTAPDRLRVDVEAGKAEVVRERDQKSVTVESGATVVVGPEAEDMAVGSLLRPTTEPRRSFDFPAANGLLVEPDGAHLLAATYREVVRYPLEGGPPEKVPLTTEKGTGRFCEFSQDGTLLAAYRGLSRDPVVVWDLASKRRAATVDARVTDRRFALAPDGSWLATVDRDDAPSTCRVWDAATGAERFTVTTDAPRIEVVAASPDGKTLAVGVVDLGKKESNRILLVNAATGEQRGDLPVWAKPLTALAFSPDGRFLAAGLTGLVQIWDLSTGRQVRAVRGFERVLLTLKYSPTGDQIAAGTADGQVWVWDAATGEAVQVIQAGPSGVRLLAYTPDGRALVTGGIKHVPLMLWDVAPRRPPPART